MNCRCSVEHEERAWNTGSTAHSPCAARLSTTFLWGVELWNKKYSIYKNACIYGRLFERYICANFVEVFENFVPRFHGCHVTLAPQGFQVWNTSSTVFHGSTFLEEIYGTENLSNRMY